MSNYWLDKEKSKSPKVSEVTISDLLEQIRDGVVESMESMKNSSYVFLEMNNFPAAEEKSDFTDVKGGEEVNFTVQTSMKGFLPPQEAVEYLDLKKSNDCLMNFDTISAGDANGDSKFTIQSVPADINFYTHGEERLRIAEDGGFYVNGKLVTTDIEVYQGMKNWLASVGLMKG